MELTKTMKDEVYDYLCYEEQNVDYMEEDGFFLFYHRCLKADMDVADADRYAILNTLIGYDIGMENASNIDTWMYEHDYEIYELNATDEKDKAIVALAVAELGLNVDLSNWRNEEFAVYSYFE